MLPEPKNPIPFWLSRIGFTLLSFFFLGFGITLLISAYDQDGPFKFIMTFFASNLIILISAVIALGFILSMIRRVRGITPEQLIAEMDAVEKAAQARDEAAREASKNDQG